MRPNPLSQPSKPKHSFSGPRFNGASPVAPAMTYSFTGTLAGDPTSKGFVVLAGPGGAALPTDGFAKPTVIDRPRRVGYTLIDGYDPIVFPISIRFDTTVPGWNVSPNPIGTDMQVLEWMAGRGKLYGQGTGYGPPAHGNPPIVKVSSPSTVAIPPNLQGIEWVISNLTYDPSTAILNADAYKRLDCVVELTQWEGVPGTAPLPGSPYIVLSSTSALDTMFKVVKKSYPKATDADMRAVLALSKTHGYPSNSYRDKLKPGTKIYIPNSVALGTS